MATSAAVVLRRFALLASVFLVVAGCGGAKASVAAEDKARPATPVRLSLIERGPVSRPIRATGVVRLKREIDLSFKVGGVVAGVFVEEGARVKKGQLLARLDPTEVDAALRQAKEGATKAERDLDRVRRLHASGALPLSEMQNAETVVLLARASVDAAAFNLQRASMFAPDDGRVDRRLVEAGEVVSPGRPVFHLSGEAKGAVVRVGVTDRDALRLREGDPARVTIDARPDPVLAARVSQLATVATPGIGTFDVELGLAALPPGLPSGLTVKVEIDHVEEVPAIVPLSALVDARGRSASVFVAIDAGGSETRARKVPVNVAFFDGSRAALSTPMEGHANVVAAGAMDLEDGSAIKVTR